MKNLNKLMILGMVATFGIVGVGCSGNSGSDANSPEQIEQSMKESTPENFPEFTAKDMDGKEVTSQIFKENKATVVNFWFTGCGACIQEMPDLEKTSKDLEAKGVKLIGVCTDSNTEEGIKEAKKILDTNKVTYTNLIFDSSKEVDDYVNTIMAYPTTLVINKDGKVVGKPIIGSIDSPEQLDILNKTIEEAMK